MHDYLNDPTDLYVAETRQQLKEISMAPTVDTLEQLTFNFDLADPADPIGDLEMIDSLWDEDYNIDPTADPLSSLDDVDGYDVLED